MQPIVTFTCFNFQIIQPYVSPFQLEHNQANNQLAETEIYFG